jgi:hypothetical protein
VVCAGGTRTGGGRDGSSLAMHGTWRAEESKAQMPVGEAGGANGDVEAEANWPRDRSETLSVVSASRKRKAPC